MVKVIMDVRGSGKTKGLIASINDSVNSESGSVICIEKGDTLRFDINYRVRLVNAEEYEISGLTLLKGFVSGLHAGNFDISHIFIDNLHSILGADKDKIEEFCDWCDAFAKRNSLNFTFTVTNDPDTASEGLKKYL